MRTKETARMRRFFSGWWLVTGDWETADSLVSSFRAKARNLFRSRSGKGCEDSGERETPCSQRIGRTVFHADSITKENGNGKRKRSLGCARDDETGSGWFLTRFQIAAIHPLPSVCPSSTSSQRGGMPEELRRAFFSYRRRV